MKEKKAPNHIFVPKHNLLNKEDTEKLLKRYNISLGQLPRISKKDPALRGLDAKPNDIIKIIRNSSTADKAVYYRVVTND